MGESQGGGKGLDMSPCSLASAQRVFWEEGGNLDGKRKKRKKRSDSRQVRKNDGARPPLVCRCRRQGRGLPRTQ